jgi:hypothetical protein
VLLLFLEWPGSWPSMVLRLEGAAGASKSGGGIGGGIRSAAADGGSTGTSSEKYRKCYKFASTICNKVYKGC